MRLRKVKNAEEIVSENSDIVIQNPEEYKGKWRSAFNNSSSANLSVELGCGKGQFLTQNALRNKENDYIGIEMMTSVICRAVQKVLDTEVKNVLLINRDGINILDLFAEGELDRLYLNFPDPWPKARHEKRRLTSPRFLEKYKVILKEEGVFRLRTDNYGLYTYSLETLSKALKEGFKYGEVEYKEDEVTTEFETKFRNQGNPIYFIEGNFKR